jgi:ubiquinone biosynthesis protein COQ9
MLAAVYASTLLVWLDDKSPGKEQSWEFLDRRIGDVMKVEGAKQKFKKMFG